MVKHPMYSTSFTLSAVAMVHSLDFTRMLEMEFERAGALFFQRLFQGKNEEFVRVVVNFNLMTSTWYVEFIPLSPLEYNKLREAADKWEIYDMTRLGRCVGLYYTAIKKRRLWSMRLKIAWSRISSTIGRAVF